MTNDLEFIAKIISNNRVTIPQTLVDFLDLEEGITIKLEIKKVMKKNEEVITC